MTRSSGSFTWSFVLRDFGLDELADLGRNLLAQYTDRAGRRHHNQHGCLAAQNRLVETRTEFRQESVLFLVMFHGTPFGASRALGAARPNREL
jgi:hypothetical protein